MNAKRTLVAVFVVTLTAAAPIPGASAAVPGEACALLDRGQASTALGVSVEPGKRLVASDTRSCGWAEPGGPRLTARKVVLTLMTERQFELGKASMKGITKTPTHGIGDDAYYVTAAGLGTALSVKKGSFFFQVKVGGGGFPVEKLKTLEKTLALEVLTKA